ncbi:hypothetical protein FRX31_022613 [Thalictrum thalictroides]|uniref:FBD domain-containing protein n=1 Tax=Thalictrum thalictroides TaxID=46969 RepID=A0A7J6VU97_THATH|nr:hypothetical protein FRX31_022613 [Thalictrum thalictroides]
MHSSIDQGHLVAFLLRSCPNIQELSIKYPWHKTLPLEMACMEKYWKSNEFFAGDLLKHLRTVSIAFFQGSESEVDIVRFLLHNASNLEKMNIFLFDPEEDQNLETRMMICQDLLNIPKVSPQAKVHIFSRDRVAYASNS